MSHDAEGGPPRAPVGQTGLSEHRADGPTQGVDSSDNLRLGVGQIIERHEVTVRVIILEEPIGTEVLVITHGDTILQATLQPHLITHNRGESQN